MQGIATLRLPLDASLKSTIITALLVMTTTKESKLKPIISRNVEINRGYSSQIWLNWLRWSKTMERVCMQLNLVSPSKCPTSISNPLRKQTMIKIWHKLKMKRQMQWMKSMRLNMPFKSCLRATSMRQLSVGAVKSVAMQTRWVELIAQIPTSRSSKSPLKRKNLF